MRALIASVLASVMAACSAAITPTPSDSTRAPDAASVRPAPLVGSAATEAPAPRVTPRPELGSEIDVHVLGRDVTGPVGEFVSDAGGIVYAGHAQRDPAADATPDLWRFVPGPDARPELMWSNPRRDHTIVKIAADLGMVAFAEIPPGGERAWNLWLLPEPGGDPVLLDSHPGDPDVSSLVPSIAVYQPVVAWTAFDRGASGPVSQLLTAAAPDWTPRIVLERPASEAELWLPSLYGTTAVFTEVRYAADRLSDERLVHLVDVGDPASVPRRLDTSGRATMPLISDRSVVWKETDPGFSMFNWGRMVHHDLERGETSPLSTWPQEYVNYPSIGSRFVAWWGADAFTFGVFDLVRDRARIIKRFTGVSRTNVVRPHIAGDFLVWAQVTGERSGMEGELRWAWLPNAGADR